MEMNAAFNVGFIHEQSFAEQEYNRASLREFHGEKIGNGINRGVRRFEASIDGLDAAMEKNEKLIEMVRSFEMLPEFEKALEKHLKELDVNSLPRVGNDGRQIFTLEDILLVLQSEFSTLREKTQKTVASTQELKPQIGKGLFVATVLEGLTPFNEDKISLGFGRNMVETFMSRACHATILASEENFPLGYEFLLEVATRVQPKDKLAIMWALLKQGRMSKSSQ
jgi:hypothetical protein